MTDTACAVTTARLPRPCTCGKIGRTLDERKQTGFLLFYIHGCRDMMCEEELWKLKTEPLDAHAMEQARARLDDIAKPIDGLGQFEKILVQLAGIQRTADIGCERRAVLVMCADNGVVEEGVAQTSDEVTALVAANMAAGRSSVNRMAAVAGADVLVTDIGIRGALSCENVRARKIRNGTANFAREPAMTRQEALAALHEGIVWARECRDQGYSLLGVGEMGIGNTTTATAVCCALLGLSPERMTGRGAGLDDEGLVRKRAVISRAIEGYRLERADALTALAAVGGLDIAGIAGVMIGGALCRMPVVLDGLITEAAALVADRLVPGVRRYLIASHLGREPLCQAVTEELALHPVICADMALGEGTGAVMLLPLLDMALSVYRQNDSFAQMHMEGYRRYREGDVL